MTPDSAMVLTGKQALDYSGGVSAEDNLGIGGYERIMGPNGQAQYWAPDLAGGLPHAARATTTTPTSRPASASRAGARPTDPIDRDVRGEPHTRAGSELAHGRRHLLRRDEPGPQEAAFDIRTVMRPRCDQDHAPLERWAAMRDAENAVVWDAHLGGWPVALLGIESRPLRGSAWCRPTAPSSGPPARCSRCRRRRSRARSTPRAATVRSSCWPTCRASTARPSRCASCSSSSAPRSAARS